MKGVFIVKDEKQIVGIQKIDFTPENQSSPIQGYKFFFLEPIPYPGCIGNSTQSYFVNAELLSGKTFKLGKWSFDLSVTGRRVRILGLEYLGEK